MNFLLCWSTILAQTPLAERIKSIRVEGTGLAQFPLAHRSAHPVTLRFDIDAPHPEHLRVAIIHCDKNWLPTPSPFINDESQITPLEHIPYQEAPPGVRGYRWIYTFQLPGFPGWEYFRYSGNYRIEIWNRSFTELLAHARMFVTEEQNDSLLDSRNNQLPSTTFPWYQAHSISLSYILPLHDEWQKRSFTLSLLRTCDIYVNRKLNFPYRIDVDDTNPYTFVQTIGTRKMIFRIDSILPGNEYRTLDFRDVALYPPRSVVRSINGTDIVRFFERGTPDNDGTSLLTSGTQYADYETVRFELTADSHHHDTIFIVGDFNGWTPSKKWVLSFDSLSQRYYLTTELRRGRYDYQYVLNNNWYTLEGNDWRTENVYTALLYYSDPSMGGYDRIIFAAQRKNRYTPLTQDQ
ncbi:MAG: DUF5103 domain-containing protein [Bacteroidetes bacterium]|nr:DUF5103 domain-containing protein [Bacteroidota bacterium]